jgi:hypothetical protein
MPTISVSLGKAHKLLEQLKGAQSGPALRRGRRRFFEDDVPATTTGVVAIHLTSVAAAAEPAQVLGALQRQAAQAVFGFEERLTLQRDALEIKEAVFAANQASGASRTMLELSLAKAELAALTGARDAVVHAGVDVVPVAGLTEDLVARLRLACEKPDARDVTLTVAIFDVPYLETRLRSLRVEINRLDDELRRLNGSTTVSVALSDGGAALLGLL